MAILVTLDKIVKTVQPKNGKSFDLDEMNQIIGGWPDPFKVGPVWVMQREESSDEFAALNEIASNFFDVALYGHILVVPAQQLPLEWELLEDHEKFFTAEMVDSSFMLSLKTSIELMKMREEQPPLYSNMDPVDFFNHQFYIPEKEEFVYNPDIDVALNPDLKKFLNNSYEYITKSPMQFKKGVILEDADLIIRTPPENRKTVLGIMLNMFLENEEYEKCAEIQKLEKLTIC